MANSSIKLYYFNVQGRGNLVRLLLTVAGKEFEDIRINRETWLEMKPTSPCGTLPILEIDGRRFGQNRAIASYLARELGFAGQSNLDSLKIDHISQTAEDFTLEYAKRYFYVEDAAKKEEGREHLRNVSAPMYLGFFEESLKAEGTGFTVGTGISLGDLVLVDLCTGFLKPFVESSLSKFPLVQAVVAKVLENEKAREFLAKESPAS